MKRIMITLVAATLMATSSMAQDNNNQQRPPKMDKTEMAKMQTQRMVKVYGLNDTQAEQLLQLNTTYADKMPMGGPRPGGPRPPQKQGNVDATTSASAQTDRPAPPSDADRETHMKEMKANREAYNAELQKIMTTDQYTQYQENEKNRRNKRPQKQDK